jgi:transcription elongation factor Elf1
MEIEHFFICPYCWQNISMILDLSVNQQTYIEDCEVCCRPIQIRYMAENEELSNFEADSIEQ